MSKYGSTTYKWIALYGVEELELINIIHLQPFYKSTSQATFKYSENILPKLIKK